MKRKNVAILSAAFVAAAAIGLAAANFRGSDKKILRVANQKRQVKLMMTASGVLKGAPYKVEWPEFPAAQPLLEAVDGVAADLGLAADAPFIFACQSGGPVKAIAVHRPLRQCKADRWQAPGRRSVRPQLHGVLKDEVFLMKALLKLSDTQLPSAQSHYPTPSVANRSSLENILGGHSL